MRGDTRRAVAGEAGDTVDVGGRNSSIQHLHVPERDTTARQCQRQPSNSICRLSPQVGVLGEEPHSNPQKWGWVLRVVAPRHPYPRTKPPHASFETPFKTTT